MAGVGDVVSAVGGAVGSLFKAQGNAAEAASYTGAAQLETQNAQLTAASTRIQETQIARQVSQSLGTTQADVAGAGFTESGSALDILRSSAQQGALAASLVNIQGNINENAYAALSGADLAKAKAANEANTAGTISAIASVGGSLINNAGSLVTAGKTVVSGIKSIFSSDPTAAAAGLDTSAASWVNAAGDSVAAGTPGAIRATAEQASSLASSGGAASFTDQAITQGGGAIDASAPSLLGTAFDTVSTAVSGAFDAASSAVSAFATDLVGSQIAGDLIPGLNIALLLDQIPAVQNIPVIGPVLNTISSAVGDVVDGVVSVVSDIGHAVGSVFGSVICTALYKRGMLTRQVWYGAQKYGRDVAPEHIYMAYLLWGKPIARAIAEYEWFAKLAAPVFVPWAHELAILAGEKTAVSTIRGRVIFKVTYAFSWVLGKVFYKRSSYVEA